MDVAYTRRNLGYVLWRKGDLEGGLEQQHRGLAARRGLASADTLNVRGIFLLSEGYSLVAQAFLRLGEPDSSIQYSQAALGLLTNLKRRPNAPDWTGNELAFVHGYLGNAYEDAGDLTTADYHYRKTLEYRGTRVYYDAQFGLVIYRMVEQYAHFLDRRGDSEGSVAQHRVVARVLRDMDNRLEVTSGSPTAYCDVVAGLCHTAEYVAPYAPAYADSLYAFAIETAHKRLGDDHELTSRVVRARARFKAAAVRPAGVEYPSDFYCRAPWRLSKRNAMWGDNAWPPAEPHGSASPQVTSANDLSP
jgi:tetratricopeptide (TPR) repeat protein